MKRIRIGKDIEIHWPILTNGQQVALEGRDLRLFGPFAFAYGHSRRFHHRRQHRDFHHQRSNAKIHRGVPSHHVGEFAEERANGGRLLQGLRIGSYDTFGRWRRRKQPYNRKLSTLRRQALLSDCPARVLTRHSRNTTRIPNFTEEGICRSPY